MLAAQDIFARINAQAASGGGEGELGVSVSFFEIYGMVGCAVYNM